jgi:HAD superfamily hydrolase (TIGR01509 family)
MRTRAVLFDYGLTLVTFEYPTQCLLEVLEEARQWLGAGAPTAEWLLFHVLHPLEEELSRFGDEEEIDYLPFYQQAWKRAGLDPDPEILYRILDLEQRCWDRAVQVAPGALELLDRLRHRGLLIGICSNAPFPPEMMRRQVDGNGIGPRMDAVIFSSDIGKRKPAPEPYRAALTELGVEPGSTLFVGDRLREDYEGPRALGMRAVLCTAFAREEVPTGVATVGQLAELEDLL